MNKQIYEEKSRYVEALNQTLAPMQDFDRISYARDAISDEEFIKISDLLGGYVYIDVTGGSLETILMDVSRVVLNNELEAKHFPAGIIHDRDKLRDIAPLFRTGAQG